MPASTATDPPRLVLEHVSKTFGHYRALDDVSFEVAKGELHGLVGQNGSGKSTLVKVLTGYHAPDRGAVVRVDGEGLRLPAQPTELHRHHVAVVHQTLGLLDEMTVVENLRLGRFIPRRFSRRIDWTVERTAALDVLERLGCEVDLNAPVGSLSPETKATVAIARAISGQQPGSGLIIFDESTRALNRDALSRFYELIRGVIDSGASVLLICHRMEEVLERTDRVTVLRDGKLAAAGLSTAELTEAELTRAMLGRSLTRQASRSARQLGANAPAPAVPTGQTRAGVTVNGLSGETVTGLDLRVEPGEIVGLTGLVGSGFAEVPYLLSGASPATAGTLTVGDRSIELAGRAPGTGQLLAAGVALVPHDRDRIGLMLDESIKVNITLPRVKQRGHRLLVGRGWERAETVAMIEQLGITPPQPDMLVASLSGGNQQKVLLGKWLAGKPQLLLLHEPTQAVDVGARQDILAALEEVAARGCAIVIASTYADELAMICTRVLVFHEGAVVAECSGELSEDEIIDATFRTHKRESLAQA